MVEIKCGIEIHQQLLTHKLFCPCSSEMVESAEAEFARRLRPVPGELGDVDVAAQYEFLRNRLFIYKTYPKESCLVELDEEPPHAINFEALETAIMVALMLKCKIPDEIHVMRKIVIDGSDTTGFQRTALVGMDGWIETSFGKVGITNVCLEEESAQILGKEEGGKIVYGLNRYGIPLIEIGTSAEIKNPEQAREVAEKIGMILRSTGKVKTGLGTIRQDLNISIDGGERVEIKGVQSLSAIPIVLELEAKRQEAIIKSGQKVKPEVRRAKPDGTTEYLRPLPGSARMYPETDCPPIVINRQWLSEIELRLPELIDEKVKRYVKEYKLSWEIASQLVHSDMINLFEYLAQWADPRLVASVLTGVVKNLKREGIAVERLEQRHYQVIFEAVKEGKIAKEAIPDVIRKLAERPEKMDEVIKSVSVLVGEEDVRNVIKDIIKSKPELKSMSNPFQAYMGIIMERLRGKVPGSTIAKILKEELAC